MTKMIQRIEGSTKAATNVMISAARRMIVAGSRLSLKADSN